ncbi:hypothetical protein EN845_28630 [Mesorhizobium sp. M8A.F.Ca.ET.202.01.1.1]|nr:hypothetical protein EN845_28630 [Mesorhizobium sp. M8A.F.Ca.ET.202.01.1.1]TGR19830.1 hypothetical protein EN840_28460 [Mesorhizobium sp. M8A.F.Ca.ET.197.01.1.1]TGR37746.1 hypothetical protein EN842_48500 [bacterium M00.F.Ca.ET.199.01.1.1]TGR43039.1 hypothetical protein EN841_28455 [Mesorhizobium sp. M8A.F.Ca.ET.198.01.1.1]TGU22728.1 hypothetical protein EN799_51055 [bacterium M00.F.Ca.ET.156.01.1.1]TGV82938.1 hypothetical protein EN792_027895 [Mesorhizobium sp. M00.F.Ca.ET.149.01.1.1]
MPTVAFLRAPLCPAGHLPHEGGDRMSSRLSPISNVAGLSEAPRREAPRLLISPLVGEMSGRTEGGAVPPTLETEAR